MTETAAPEYDTTLEHEYIEAPGTEGDLTGPLVCEFCGMSAECADDEVHGCLPHPAPDLSHFTTADDYYVPVDPMDLLQCDSCQ